MGAAPTRDARGIELENEREVDEGRIRKLGARKSGSGSTVLWTCFESRSGLQLTKVIRAGSSADNDL